MKTVYIFRLLTMLTQAQKEQVREELKQQISEGIVLMGNNVEFVKRELKVLGTTVKIEFIEGETENENN